MLFVSDLHSSHYRLPSEYLDCLPTECPYCGSPTLIRESMTGLTCIDKRCPSKLVQRTLAILDDLNVKGMGSSMVTKFLEYHQVRNPLNLLEINQDIEMFPGQPSNTPQIIDQIQKAVQRPRTLGEYVKIANLPGLRVNAIKLIQGYDDLDMFYHDIESGGIDFVSKRLGISSSLTSQNLYTTLLEYKEDLIEDLPCINLLKTQNLTNYQVCISDTAGPEFASKRDFMTQVSQIPGYHVTFLDSVSKKIDALIWHPSGRYTSKVKRVESYGTIPILSGVEFITKLQNGEGLQ